MHPSQRTKFLSMGTATNWGSNSVNTFVQPVMYSTDAIDESAHYVSKAMFNVLHSFLEIRQLYSLKEQDLGHLPEETKCDVQRGTLTPIFQKILPSVTNFLGVEQLGAHRTQMFQLGEELNTVTRTAAPSRNLTTVREISGHGLVPFVQGPNRCSSVPMSMEWSPWLITAASTGMKVEPFCVHLSSYFMGFDEVSLTY